jgi:DNA-directed RNA polymerase specialized sigma24 family protein
VFHLHYFMGCELREVAEDILAIPYATVKSRWKAAKTILHRVMAESDS